MLTSAHCRFGPLQTTGPKLQRAGAGDIPATSPASPRYVSAGELLPYSVESSALPALRFFPDFSFPPKPGTPYLEVLPEMRGGRSPTVTQALAPQAGGAEMLCCCGAGAPGDGEPLGWDPAKGWGRCPGCPYGTAGLPAHAKQEGSHRVHAQVVAGCEKSDS